MKNETKKTVLLVEDEYLLAMAEQMRLAEYGYIVMIAHTGENAIAIIEEKPEIEIVLMDINLGNGMDGTEAAREILKRKNVPIVFLSSHCEPTVVEKTEKITSYGYVVKNSGITVLDASIKMAFKLFESNQRLVNSEERYRRITDSIIDYVYTAYLENGEVVKTVHGSACFGITGFSSDEFSVDPYLWFKIIVPEDRDRVNQHFSDILTIGTQETIVHRIIRKDGIVRWIANTPVLNHNAAGKLVSYDGVIRDITDRIVAEDKLRETNEMLSLFITRSPVIAYIKEVTTTESRLLQASYNYQQIMRIRELDIIGKTMTELFPPEFAKKETVEDISVIESGQVMEFFEDLNGRNYSSVKFPILKGDKRLLAGYCIDITERKHAEMALADSETRYRRLFETAQDGILILDADSGRITDVNPYLIGLLGYSKEQLISKAIWEIGLFKDVLVNKGNFLELQQKRYIRYEDLPLVTSRGEKIDVEFVSNVYFVNHNKVIQCNIRNIMDRKQEKEQLNNSEIKYRRLFETAQDGILILDADTGEIVDVNPFLVDMLGYSKEQFLNKAIWEIGLFKDIVANKANFIELQNREYLRYEDLPLETASGEIAQVEFVSNVYLVDLHKVIQCNIRNITDRKIGEKKINELLVEKELLLKEVHHRIKNNMFTISSLLALQAENIENPVAKEALEDAQGRIQSMMVLYNRLFQSTNYRSIPIAEYISALIDEIMANFPNRNAIKIQTKLDDFELDAGKLQPLGIIINELLTNIMKYAFAGKSQGIITICASAKDKQVTISVEDDGIGLPVTVDFDRSTGFGLMLIRQLTDQLKGSIRIERGNGTKILLEFGDIV
jgi:PAS domain S-box-containing protein